MEIEWEYISMPKYGNRDDENEDSGSARESKHAHKNIFRAAIADGATESIYSKAWANILVESFLNRKIHEKSLIRGPIIEEISANWKTITNSPEIPWYIEEKLQEGSYAALLGVNIGPYSKSEDDTWLKYVSIGDCCLFWHSIRAIKFISSPQKNFTDFTSRPFLVGTNSKPIPKERISRRKWKICRGDIIMLMTDALACFFMKLNSEDPQSAIGFIPWLKDKETQKEIFQQRIHDARQKKTIKNDDSSVLIIRII
ncbi:MAG: hypothetical protein IPI28_13220 [Candidatus Omnitrophica bacterium]|nr:hypothetical protein [Candidatus Omnitrophota bacterium]